jgi:hypothetical protein
MIGFIGTFFTVTLNHNQLQPLTINDCLRLASFLTGLRVSSLLVCLLLGLTWFRFTNELVLPSPFYCDSFLIYE